MPCKDLNERKAYDIAYRERNREKARLNTRQWRKANPDYTKGYYSRYMAQNPNYYKARNLKQYGLTLEEYNDLLWKQGYRCAL